MEYSNVKSVDLKSELGQTVSILAAKPKSRQADEVFSSLETLLEGANAALIYNETEVLQ